MTVNFSKCYQEQGFVVLKGFFSSNELTGVAAVLAEFHRRWCEANKDFYLKQAINSAYITAPEFLTSKQRVLLFEFISQCKIQQALAAVFTADFCFMNSQLFFDPVNTKQKNYWHRDPQYHMNLAEQQAALMGPQVVHCRIALKDEPGMEFIPGSHKAWDTPDELAVRLEQDGHKNHQSLGRGQAVALEAGDVLLFDANMIHRGLYGQDRLAWDLLFCQRDEQLMAFIRDDILPTQAERQQLAQPEVFVNP